MSKKNNQVDKSKNRVIIHGELIEIIQVSKKEYELLITENKQLRDTLLILESNNNLLKEELKTRELTIEELKKENELLNKEIKRLNEELNKMKNEMSEMKNKMIYNEALFKLHDCDAMANNAFKKEYKKYYKLKSHSYIPNIGDFVRNPPDEEDDDYEFWIFFCKKYKNSDKKEFQDIYKIINNNRMSSGAHYDVSNIKEDEYMNLLKLVMPEYYNTHKDICEEYKKWLYLFN